MNNKYIGAEFERETCRILSGKGWWVHFISPNNSGSQPFDIIAVKNGFALAADCKTSVRATFPFSRLEENQVMAFDKWLACGNPMPFVIVKYGGIIYAVPYSELKEIKSIKLSERYENIFKKLLTY